MESESEKRQNDDIKSTSANRHGNQQELTDGLEGLTISTRTYRHNVTDGNARAHYGDQHNHYYAGRSGGHDTEPSPKDPMQQLLGSLSFPQKNFRLTVIEPAYQQTCQWLFETPEYARWRHPDLRHVHHGIVWLKGKPGAGKSTITKCALEHANAMYPSERNIHFFFNARGDKLERCSEGMYRSLLHQVARSVPSLVQSVHTEAVEGYSTMGWPLNLLRSLFREAALHLASTAQLNCYIDALDEGEDEDQIREIVLFFEELAETAVTRNNNLSIYLASRHYPNITIRRSEIVILDNCKGHHADIASYVRSKLSCRPPTLKAELVTSIIERSSGLFLWVVLVVRILNMQSDRGNQHRLKEFLEATPRGLNDLFGDIIGDGDTDGTLLPTLLWALFAKRPMSPLELYLAVIYCTNPDSCSSVIWDHAAVDVKSIKNFVTSSSRGLLQVVAPAKKAVYPPWYKTFRSAKQGQGLVVQFIRESVREYLLGKGLLRLDPALTENLVGIGNLRLARWCQSYLELGIQYCEESQSTNTALDEPFLLLRDLIKLAPFSRYALAEIWHHSEKAASRGLQVPIPFEDYLHTYLPLSNICMTGSSRPNLLSSLYVLAEEGCPNLTLNLLQRHNEDVGQVSIDVRVKTTNGGSQDHGFALHLAARHLRFDVVSVLLENGVDVNARHHEEDTTLLYAMKNRLNELLQIVLKHGADVNARDRFGETALHHLAKTDETESFKALMQCGADVNARNKGGLTPLMIAAKKSKLAMVKALLAHDPDVNAKDEDGCTSLHHTYLSSAVESIERSDILLQLLQHGADTNLRGGTTAPPLTIIVHNQFRSVEDVRLLIRYGADINAGVRSYETALHVAAGRRDLAIVNTLLQHDADVNARDRWEATPLIRAVTKRDTASTAVTELLLKNGADVNAVTKSNCTALRLAVELENVEVTKMLLVHGADAFGQKKGKRFTKTIAKGKDNKVIARLLDYFADMSPPTRLEAEHTLEQQEWWKN